MTQTRQTKCSSCGQPIRTFSGALAMRNAPVVCRRCFGHQTYETKSALPLLAVVAVETPTVAPEA